MDKDNNTNDIEIILDSNVENIFTDLVQLNIDNETVKIGLAIRNFDNNSAKISHNVIMTLPHFLRFADICQQSTKKIISQIEKLKSE